MTFLINVTVKININTWIHKYYCFLLIFILKVFMNFLINVTVKINVNMWMDKFD